MTSIQSRFGRSFVEQYGGGGGSVAQRDNRGFRTEDLQQSIEERRSRGRGRGKKEQVDPTAPVVVTQPVDTPPPPATTPPATNPSPPTGSSPTPIDSSVRSLAEKYVDVYAQQSGKPLSSATRDALVADVASFYGENGTRTERLRTLVGVF
jgi:hypothetical protein